jgi:uncharacterized membrane protein
MLPALHVLTAALALLVGAVQLRRPKGTRAHRRIGWAYALLLLVLNTTALSMYRETGRWNHFHWLAVASLVTLVVALGALAADRHRWWPMHAYAMAGSYLGVILAGVFQLATHVPQRGLALTLAAAFGLVVGVWLLAIKTPRDLRTAAGQTPARSLTSVCG